MTMPRTHIRSAVVLLLALAACDGGGGGGGGGTVVEPPPVVKEDTLQVLLTDAQLATPADPDASPENPEWSQWVVENHWPMRSLTSDNFQDLQFLKPLLQGRRVVQLGESSHGVREFNLSKARLVRFLHQEMGYDVVAFESNLHDCWQTSRQGVSLSAQNMMRECIFAVWHAQELVPLFTYIRAQSSSARPLVLAGFDVQPTGRGAMARSRPELLHEVIAKVDPQYAAHVRTVAADQVDRYITNVLAFVNYLRAHSDSLIGEYRGMEDFLTQHQAALAAHFPADPEKPRVALAAARSARVFLQQYSNDDVAERVRIRDEGMADNVDYLLDVLYPGKKVIVWGHNGHIAEASPPGELPAMGAYLHGRRGAELYTVGLFMYRGQAALNNRDVYTVISPHLPGSLESILYRARKRWTFVDFSTRASGAGTSWMFQPTRSMSWGSFPETIVPREFYDGVLFIDTTSPPSYFN
jgi:erythromycin esterase